MKQKLCLLAVSAMTIAALWGGTALAANGAYTVSAQLSPDITINIDGATKTFFNSQGQEVHPISYAGTTYLPLRAIGELMDKNVNWDAATCTVTIGGERVTADASGQRDTNAQTQAIRVAMEPSYTIVIDGVQRTFYDGNGKKCDPAVYQGSVYLPIRAIGEIMGKTVDWNETTETVSLSGSAASGEVTDYDTANPSGQTGNSNPNNPSTPAGTISLDRAKQIALDHAGRSAAQVTFVKNELERDDGRQVYEIEFIVASGSQYLEYDYEIDANTGNILSYDQDAEGYRPGANNPSSNLIGETRAKEIVLAKVPGATTANIYGFQLDYDDGRAEYEGKIVYNQREYEFTIDAATGNIIDWEVDSIYD